MFCIVVHKSGNKNKEDVEWKMHWGNPQHVIRAPANAIDDVNSCINILNGCKWNKWHRSERDEKAKKKKLNNNNNRCAVEKDLKSMWEKRRYVYAFASFRYGKWSDAITVDIETKWNLKWKCGREKVQAHQTAFIHDILTRMPEVNNHRQQQYTKIQQEKMKNKIYRLQYM